MHQCLSVTEIFTHICAILSTQGARGDLASLARTCRAFHGPATEALWERLDDIGPLFDPMEGDLYEFEEPRSHLLVLPRSTRWCNLWELTFNRPATATDLAKFKARASRVRYLSVQLKFDDSWWEILSKLQALATYTDYPFFSKLLELRIDEFATSQYDDIPLDLSRLGPFATASLHHLHFNFSFYDNHSVTFFTDFVRRFPSLLDLRVQIPLYEDVVFPRSFEDMVPNWDALQRVEIAVHYREQLQALSRLGHLERLQIGILFCEGIPDEDIARSGGFPKLRDLSVQAGAKFDLCIRFLSLLRDTPLCNLGVETSTISPDGLSQLFDTLTRHVNPRSLEILRVRDNRRRFEGLPPLVDDPYQLHSLQPFRNLRTLILQIPFVSTLLPILSLGQFAPSLTTLQLGYFGAVIPAYFEPKIHIQELAAICQTFPRLTELAIPVDASKPAEPSPTQAHAEQQTRLTKLSVSMSPIDCTSEVALFLSDAFPNLESLHASQLSCGPSRPRAFNWTDQAPEWHKAWQKVMHWLPVLKRARAQERSRAFSSAPP
ncbi:hypothetical protein CC1G_04996 [Coprinopsis cinerea okayama7|uniref:F-box domain-containing protein n=1 Tax=Coprinopsis cinerea (strain Okayama-7 / 130 / ATCC MYA-4618 / FGSC 9003) TaxID=240176 RepID=A8NSF9_COPC7|nr:hypothetical protein CC1G_04996 [Coprinopsis cinerea okayama7\|eukprot:XP_001836003.1 hypothetical protein CC1G_04996 [Coprinopsis cinerea okayama7\